MTISLEELPLLRLSDPGFYRDAPDVLAARHRGWCARTEHGIAVLRHDAVKALINDRRLTNGLRNWTHLNGVTSGPWAEFFPTLIVNLEGEPHDRIRRLINPVFSSRAADAHAGEFHALANELIDQFIDSGHCDFIEDFAAPYATTVLCLILGIPKEHGPVISRWAVDLSHAFSTEIRQELPRVEAALAELSEYVEDLIEGRGAPLDSEGLVSRLIQIEQGGQRLSPSELRMMLTSVLMGGSETTKKQLGIAMQTFVEHPDQWRLLAKRPELAEAAVNEVMRIQPTISWVAREAAVDFTYEGLDIPEGTVLHLFTQAASTDPHAGAGATFDITADRPSHFGFGAGIHHCAGHFIARRDMAVALAVLARRLRDPRIDGEATWLPLRATTGPISLPVSFTAGA